MILSSLEMYRQMLRELGVSDSMPPTTLDSLPRLDEAPTSVRGLPLVSQVLYGQHVLTVDSFNKEMVNDLTFVDITLSSHD